MPMAVPVFIRRNTDGSATFLMDVLLIAKSERQAVDFVCEANGALATSIWGTHIVSWEGKKYRVIILYAPSGTKSTWTVQLKEIREADLPEDIDIEQLTPPPNLRMPTTPK